MPHRESRQIKPGVGMTFQTGLNMTRPQQPIMLNFAYQKRSILESTWSIADAQAIIAGLQKFIELHRVKFSGLTTGQDPEELLKRVKEAGERK